MEYVNVYWVIFAAILPSFLLVLYIYLRDKNQREPLGQILKGVLYGVVSAGIAMLLESLLSPVIPTEPATWLGAVLKGFVGAAIPEEFAKLTMLLLLLRNNSYFDERFDGIVYAVCIGMGFAGTENIIYLLSNIDSWQSVAVSRAIFAVPGHFGFAVAMGYFYSMLYFKDMSPRYASRVFWIPVLLHGVYDSVLFMAGTPLSQMTGISVVLVLCFYVFCWNLFKHSREKIDEQYARDIKASQRYSFLKPGTVIEDVEPVEECQSIGMSRKMFAWMLGIGIAILMIWLIWGICAAASAGTAATAAGVTPAGAWVTK